MNEHKILFFRNWGNDTIDSCITSLNKNIEIKVTDNIKENIYNCFVLCSNNKIDKNRIKEELETKEIINIPAYVLCNILNSLNNNDNNNDNNKCEIICHFDDSAVNCKVYNFMII